MSPTIQPRTEPRDVHRSDTPNWQGFDHASIHGLDRQRHTRTDHGRDTRTRTSTATRSTTATHTRTRTATRTSTTHTYENLKISVTNFLDRWGESG
jgi:hypothetical protein